MVIKLLQQSTFRRYAAIVLSPFFYFCCFRCVIVPLTGVINYVFCIYYVYMDSKNEPIAYTVWMYNSILCNGKFITWYVFNVERRFELTAK